MNPTDSPLVDGACTQLLQLGLNRASEQAWPPTAQQLGEAFPDLEVVRWLGEGATGAVFHVRTSEEGQNVALKIIRPDLMLRSEASARLAREAAALQRLSHPGIAGVYGFGERNGWFYLQIEYVPGNNLRTALETPIPEQDAIEIGLQVCDALAHAHGLGVVHRDIKPDNILIGDGGAVTVVDFGLAKLRDDNDRWTLTGSSTVLGTPLYLSPEQIETPTSVDQRADIFSLGVVLYELMTGRLPIGRFADPSKLVPVSRRLERLILRSLEPDRARRIGTAAEMRAGLAAASREARGGKCRWSRRSKVALGAALAGSTVWLSLQWNRPSTDPDSTPDQQAPTIEQFVAQATASSSGPPLDAPPADTPTLDEFSALVDATLRPVDPQSPPAAAELFAEAQRAENAREWTNAANLYWLVLKHHGQHPLAAIALYRAAKAKYAAGDFDMAAMLFERYLDRSPEGADAPTAQYFIGLVYAKAGACGPSIDAFAKISEMAGAGSSIKAKAQAQVKTIERHLSGEARSTSLACDE